MPTITIGKVHDDDNAQDMCQRRRNKSLRKTECKRRENQMRAENQNKQ